MSFTAFTVFLVTIHLLLPDMTVEVFDIAFPTEEACVHFVGDAVSAFETQGITASPTACTEQEWFYKDGSI